MTLDETRQLGIEFERRVQTMIPETEYSRKIDTDTIYSFLNQYQDKYIQDIYRNLDNIQSETKLQAHIEHILQQMLTSVEVSTDKLDYTKFVITDSNEVPIIDTARSVIYKLPSNFYMYIRSVSRVSKTFSFKGNSTSNTAGIRVIPNKLMSQSEIWKMVETPNDSLRILRYPVAVLSEYKSSKPTITVIYDRYTDPEGIKVIYYKTPSHFSVTESCELPFEVFNDLVTGAVDLYVQYVAGAEANRRQQQETAQKRAREDQRDSRRSGGNQDEQS